MRKFFYFRLALSNVRRSKITYLPYLVATAVMSGVFLLIAGLLFSKGMTNTPSGDTAKALFAFGLVVYAIFTWFMLYINNFLIKRRKKEFGCMVSSASTNGMSGAYSSGKTRLSLAEG
jgi:putative ABC transport system permease protein